MTNGGRARGQILPRKQRGQRAALNVHLVHRAQPPAERRLLARALALERLDLAPQRLHVARRAFDARVQPRDLTLLVGQPLLDHLQLREHGGFARPRSRGLLPFVA